MKKRKIKKELGLQRLVWKRGGQARTHSHPSHTLAHTYAESKQHGLTIYIQMAQPWDSSGLSVSAGLS